MGYKIEVLLSAQTEIEKAYNYYSELSDDLPIKFKKELKSTYGNLAINPFYRRRYKNFRAIPLKKFPYLLFYIIEENKKKIKIISCFHTSQNPKKYPESY